jgi:hypothetical protein
VTHFIWATLIVIETSKISRDTVDGGHLGWTCHQRLDDEQRFLL